MAVRARAHRGLLRRALLVVALACSAVLSGEIIIGGGQWIRAAHTVPLHQPLIIWLISAAAGAVLVLSPAWRHLRIVDTWLHECGHALMAVVLSGEVDGIDLNRDTSGMTWCHLPMGAIHARRAIMAFCGYPAPAAAALAMAWAVSLGYAYAAVAGIGILAILTIPMMTSHWAYAVPIVVAIVCAAIFSVVPDAVILVPVVAAISGISAGCLRSLFEVVRFALDRKRYPRAPGDLGILGPIIFMPREIIVAAWVVASAAMSAESARLLYEALR